jgi:uncharacterized protein involved in exopolysaccharide biosynthesis
MSSAAVYVPPTLLKIVLRNSLPAVPAMLLALGGAVGYTALAPTYFGSEAKVFVRVGRESVTLGPEANTGEKTMTLQDSHETEVNSVFEIFRSRQMAEAVVDAFGPEKLMEKQVNVASSDASASMPNKLNPLTVYSIRDEAIKTVIKRLSITAAKRSSVISLYYEAKDPEMARQILNTLIEKVGEANTKANRSAGSLSFFADQENQERASLEKLEANLRDLKNEAGWSSLETARMIKSQRLGDLENARLHAQTDLAMSQAKADALTKMLAAEEKNIVTEQVTDAPSTATARMREQLYTLEIKEQDLLARFTPDHEEVKQVHRQVEEARRVLKDEPNRPQVTVGLNKNHLQLQLDLQVEQAALAGHRQQVTSLEQQIVAAREELKTLNDYEIAVASMQRRIDVAATNYRKYAENLEQARIDQALASERISNISVLQPPTVSETPSQPKTLLNYGVGLGGGLVSAMGLITRGEVRRRRREAQPSV